MGYYVSTEAVDLRILAKHVDDAYKAMCELNNHNELKNGGRYPREDKDGPHDGVWFSWMHWNYPDVCENAEQILLELGFEVSTEDSGDIVFYHYDSKIGNESHFLQAIAPYVNNGGYIEWRGEDGAMWRSFFEDGIMLEQTAKIEWV